MPPFSFSCSYFILLSTLFVCPLFFPLHSPCLTHSLVSWVCYLVLFCSCSLLILCLFGSGHLWSIMLLSHLSTSFYFFSLVSLLHISIISVGTISYFSLLFHCCFLHIICLYVTAHFLLPISISLYSSLSLSLLLHVSFGFGWGWHHSTTPLFLLKRLLFPVSIL